jgi:hypothetical protein
MPLKAINRALVEVVAWLILSLERNLKTSMKLFSVELHLKTLFI